jgi:hypothetical protein
MKLRIAAVLVTAFALSACTDADWSHNMSFIGLDDSDQAAAQPAPQPVAQVTPPPGAQPAPAQTAQAMTPNPFCSAVAKQDAERNDFDATTQQGVYVRSYQQCVAIFGNAGPQ